MGSPASTDEWSGSGAEAFAKIRMNPESRRSFRSPMNRGALDEIRRSWPLVLMDTGHRWFRGLWMSGAGAFFYRTHNSPHGNIFRCQGNRDTLTV